VPPEAASRASKSRFISVLDVRRFAIAAFVNPGSKNQGVLRCSRLSDSKSLSAFRISSETVSRFSCVSSPSIPLGPRHQRFSASDVMQE